MKTQVICFVAMLGSVRARAIPWIIQQPQSQIVNVGERADFVCAFRNPVGNLTMRIDGLSLTLEELNNKEFYPRYDLNAQWLAGKEGNTSRISLTIFNTTWEDETTYQCQMFNGRTSDGTSIEKLQTDVVNLTLNHFWTPPKILKQNNEKLTSVGEVLVCETGTYPEPEIRWMDENGAFYYGTSSNVTLKSRQKLEYGEIPTEPRLVFERNSTLVISPEMYSKHIELKLFCVVNLKHDMKNNRTGTIDLGFWEKAPQINYVSSDMGQSSKKLRCSVTCSPKVGIDWIHPSGHMTSSAYNTDQQKFNLINKSRVGGVLSILEIHNFDASDVGNYTCRATNGFGEASESVYGDLHITNGIFANVGIITLSVVCGVYVLVTIVIIVNRFKTYCTGEIIQSIVRRTKQESAKDSGSIMNLPLPPVSFPYQDSLPRRFNECANLERTLRRSLSPIPEEINNLNTEGGSPATIIEDLNLSFTSSTFSPIQQAIQKLDTDYSPTNVTSPLFFNCALDRSTTSSVSDNEV